MMVERILFGKRSEGQYGLYISVPGKSVLTASPEDMLLSTDLVRVFQYITQGVYAPTSPTASFDVTIPNLGFKPGFLWTVAPEFSNAQRDNGIPITIDITYPNSTTVRINMANEYQLAISYGVTNLPITAY